MKANKVYTAGEKAEILTYFAANGFNPTASKYGVSRQAITTWKRAKVNPIHKKVQSFAGKTGGSALTLTQENQRLRNLVIDLMLGKGPVID